ncbi:hypothetical protein ACQUQU_05175 [Thalassolituus sp. LLYu03]|uniref:hypothetical protein n=1 Tax=Thalassolituus sp. LLYu03 TaxID=3421656 RepID=UPI003D2E1451
MSLRAYKVQEFLVFASRGTEAKMLAAPRIRSEAEWREDVSAWVALRAERAPELDELVNPDATEAYIQEAS